VLELEVADPWDLVASLASAPRVAAWAGVVRARAAGGVVVDAAAGSGVLAVLAAAAGARQVFAFEETEQVETARALAQRNGVADRVVVIAGAPGDWPVPPADLVLFPRFGADPFVGSLAEWGEAAAMVRPGGWVAPGRIEVWAARASARGPADEAAEAFSEIDAIAAATGLDLGPVREALGGGGPYRWFTEAEEPTGAAVRVWALAPGERPRPRTLDLAGEGCGVVVWFRLEIAPGQWIGGPPGTGSPWPPLVCGWRAPGRGPVRFTTRALRIVAESAVTG
jgi:hypothetical protein